MNVYCSTGETFTLKKFTERTKKCREKKNLKAREKDATNVNWGFKFQSTFYAFLV